MSHILQRIARKTPVFKGRGRILKFCYRALGYNDREIVGTMDVRGKLMRFNASIKSGIELNALLFGNYEPAESRIIDQFVTKGAVALDVGANVGLHTLRIATLAGDSGAVIAFEPNPETRQRLIANLQLNGIGNVSVRPVAVGDCECEATLYVNSPEYGNRNATLFNDAEPECSQVPVSVSVTTLDSLELPGRVSFVKTDIEGYELKALQGGRQFLKSNRPTVMLEYNRHFSEQMKYRLKDLSTLFEDCGPYKTLDVNLQPLSNEPESVMTTVVFTCS